MATQNEVLELIEFIKKEMEKMDLNAEDVFLNGNCGNLCEILTKQFPKTAKPFVITENGIPIHLITRIEDKYYDITGETSLEKYEKYVIEHNFNISNLNLKIEDIKGKEYLLYKMRDKYRYDEDWGQSEIENQMDKLTRAIAARER